MHDPAHRELRAADLDAVREQLGREPTTPFTVVARCTSGHPLVIRNAPFDASGEPFPTTYWLTCPAAVKAVSRREAGGAIARTNERVKNDEAFAAALEAAHRAYADERGEMAPEARSWGGVAGTRTGVKCLHAHYAYHLAGGADPVGAEVALEVEPIHDRPTAGRVAVIDQGTNSIRLLVAEPSERGFAEIARDLVITRLGERVDATGQLDPRAVERTVGVLATNCPRAPARGAERIRV
ncbi:MAG: exopolyphosphatase / guanosine-5-triphosphate,3-diphosphate pyrophosphatase, partial [Solirubrobacterales bacterium]|nr:exopolyphosphatase / guanosine-5-triphosphate,3-diphosphate pyrophosphatase [Solirubrobacterales bacterium]